MTASQLHASVVYACSDGVSGSSADAATCFGGVAPRSAALVRGTLAASTHIAGSIDDLSLILTGAFGPVPVAPACYMRRRGSKDPDVLALRRTEMYGLLARWAVAAWPRLERHVELIADILIAKADRVADGRWSAERAARYVHEAAVREEKVGRPGERTVPRMHARQAVRQVPLDELSCEPPDESSWASSRPEGDLASPFLRVALGNWEYLLTDAAAAVVDECFALAVDHLRTVGDRTGLTEAGLLAACRSVAGNKPSDRLTLLLDHLPRPTRQAAARILIGAPGRRGFGLMWYMASGVPPTDIPATVLTGWRADIPALDPTLARLPGRRLERLRTAAREGCLQRISYLAVASTGLESIAV